MKRRAVVLACAAMVCAAQSQPIPPIGREAWPGTLQLRVDLRDVERRIVRVQETLPVKPGPLVLHLPRWIPGWHGTTGAITRLAGLTIRAGDRVLDWSRNLTEPDTFHVDVPAGTAQLAIEFQHLSSHGEGRVEMSQQMLTLSWNQVVLYPAGHEAARIEVQPSVQLPAGWQHASSLETASASGGEVAFRPLSLEMLVDSPLVAGAHARRIDLDPGAKAAGRAPVFLDVFADRPAQIEAAKDSHVAAHAALVEQADRLFGVRHFRHYDFLLMLSDTIGGTGLEHHESSENGVKPDYFAEWDKTFPVRSLLPHEYVHSWNGKFRRPAGQLVPNFNVPLRDDLLWVYEGQTQFWGAVLTARAGLHTPEQARDDLATTLAWLDARAGRAWRNLQDTTNEPIVSSRTWSRDWRGWSRGADYYDEMRVIWTEADAVIREGTGNQRSMDDVARAFFGPQPGRLAGDFRPLGYGFDDVVRELNRVHAFDWARFLRERLDARGGLLPSQMLRRAGWTLGWADKPSPAHQHGEQQDKAADFSHSIGLSVGEGGKLDSVAWGSPAFDAGLAKGVTLVAVNGRAWKPEELKDAITAAKTNGRPIDLLVRSGDLFRTVPLRWTGGLRYPVLVRVDGVPDHLSALFAPK